MFPSKENCQQAKETLDDFLEGITGIEFLPEEWEEETDFIREFLIAAHKELPTQTTIMNRLAKKGK